MPAEFIKLIQFPILARTRISSQILIFSTPPKYHKYLVDLFPLADPLDLSCLPMRALQIASAPSSLSRLRFSTRISRPRFILTSPRTTSLQNYSCSTCNSSLPLRNTKASPLRPLHNIMSDDKGRKQATLGYVPDSQLTIGCVNGIASAPPNGN